MTEDVASVAYCAGFLDADGTIAARRVSNSTAYTIGVLVAQKTAEPLVFFQSVLGGSLYRGNAGSYIVGLRKPEIRLALPKIIPHLIVKKSQALTLLELIALLDTKTTNWPAANYAAADTLVARIKRDKRPWLL